MKKIYFAVLVAGFLGGSLYAVDRLPNIEVLNNVIFLAVEEGDRDIVDGLLFMGADVNAISTEDYCRSLLVKAAKNNDKKMVRFLLVNNADPGHLDMTKHVAEDYSTDQKIKDILFLARTGIQPATKDNENTKKRKRV